MKTILFKQNDCRPCDDVALALKNALEVEADVTINLTTGDITLANDTVAIEHMDAFELAGQYNVMSTPVLVLTEDDGTTIRELRGMIKTNDIASMFEQRGLI